MRSILPLILFPLLLILLKIYLIRGIHQISPSSYWTVAYGLLSLGSLALGLIVMLSVFSSGMIGLRFWQNFLIALMVSVVICELLLGIFFLIDDIIGLINKLTQSSTDMASSSRRRWLKAIGLGVTALPFAAYLYGITNGKYSYRVIKKKITFKDLPAAFDGLTIAQFSDFHAGSFDSVAGVKKGIEMIQETGADLILFTGDLVNDLADEVLPYKTFLSQLQAPLGKFSILGNHDYPTDDRHFPTPETAQANLEAIKQHHQEMGFRLLNNENVVLEKDGQSIRLLGVENWGTRFVKYGDLDLALEACNAEEFCVLMSHDPSHWEEKVIKHNKKIHLTLSGHTHGMQMGVERWGIKWSPVKYVYSRWAGLYEEKNQYLYVNRGFGFIGFAGRVGMAPEVTLLTLEKEV